MGHARQLFFQNRIRHLVQKHRLRGLDKLFPETGNPNLDGRVARTPSPIGKGTASEACPERSRRVPQAIKIDTAIQAAEKVTKACCTVVERRFSAA